MVWGDRLLIGDGGRCAVFHPFERVVGKLRDHGGQHLLDAPRALLGRVVVVRLNDGQQIDEAQRQRPQGGRCVPREQGGELADAPGLEGGVVDDRSLRPSRSLKIRASANAPRGSAPLRSRKAASASEPSCAMNLQTELEGDLLVRPGAGPDGHRELGGLEVKEARGRWLCRQGLRRGHAVEVNAAAERAVLYAALFLGE